MKFKNLLFALAAIVGIAATSCSKTKTDPTPTPTCPGGAGCPVVSTGPADSVSTKFAGGLLGNTKTHSTFTFLAGKTYNITKANVIITNADVVIQAGATILFGGVPLKVTIGLGPKRNEESHRLNFDIDKYKANVALHSAQLKQLSLGNHNVQLAPPDTGSKSSVFGFYVINTEKVATGTVKSTVKINGTATSHVTFSTLETNPQWPNGYWGGITMDSTVTSAQFEWVDIAHTGGVDSIGGNQYAIYYRGNVAKGAVRDNFIMENSSVEYGVDDCTRMEGLLNLAIRGNVFKRQGSNDGDGINIKSGSIGDVCYNYCWAGANNSIKLNASTKDKTLVTNVNIYNNTIISGGWRKHGEASSGILIDAFAKGACYNNLIINCRNGFTLSNLADTSFYTLNATGATRETNINQVVGNNFIYAFVDSVAANSYGFMQFSNKRAGDISALTLAGQTDPKIVKIDRNTVGYTDQPTSYPDNNDPHLQSSSPAIGKGNSSSKNYVNALNYGSQWAPGEDIGAFQVTNATKGNLRGNN